MTGNKHSPSDITYLAREVLLRGGNVRVPTFGTSMYPLLRSGDFIHIQPAGPAIIGAGDVVVYERGSRMVAHRVVKLWEENGQLHLQTKGDAFHKCDPPVAVSQLMGKVVLIERGKQRIKIETRSQRWLASSSIMAWSCLNHLRLLTQLTRRRARSFLALFRG